MQEDVTKEIDGITYVFSYLAPSKAFPLAATIVKALLAPAGSFVSNLLKTMGAANSLLDAESSQFDFTTACEKLASNMSPQELLSIATELLKTVSFAPGPLAEQKGGVEVKMDRDFRGRPKHLMKVLAASMEVNFHDFFGDLDGLVQRGRSLLSTLVKPPSPGKSGD